MGSLAILPSFVPSCEEQKISDPEIVAEKKVEEEVKKEVKEVEKAKSFYLPDKGYVDEAEYEARFEELMSNFKKYEEPIFDFSEKEFFKNLDGFIYYYSENNNKKDLISRTQEDINKVLQNIFLYLQKSPKEELLFLSVLRGRLSDFFVRESFGVNSDVSDSLFVKTFAKEIVNFYEINKNKMDLEDYLIFLSSIRKMSNSKHTAEIKLDVDAKTFYEDIMDSSINAFKCEEKKDLLKVLDLHEVLNLFLGENDLANGQINKELYLKLVNSFADFYLSVFDQTELYEKSRITSALKENLENLDLTDEERNQVYQVLNGVNFESSMIKVYPTLRTSWNGYLNFVFFTNFFYKSDPSFFEKVFQNFETGKDNWALFLAVDDLVQRNLELSDSQISTIYNGLIEKSIKSLKSDFLNFNQYEFFDFQYRISNALDRFFKDDIKSRKELAFITADVFSKKDFGVSPEEKMGITRRLLHQIKTYIKTLNLSEQEITDMKNTLGEDLVQKLTGNYDSFMLKLNEYLASERDIYSFYVYGEYLDLMFFYSDLYGIKSDEKEKLFEDFKKLHQAVKKNNPYHSLFSKESEDFIGEFSFSDELVDFFIDEIKQDFSNPYCFSELITAVNKNPSLNKAKKIIELTFKYKSEMILREMDDYPILSIVSNLNLAERKELYSFMKENYKEIPLTYLIPLNTRQASDEFLEVFQKYLRMSDRYTLKFQMYIQDLNLVNVDFNNLAYLIKGMDELANDKYSSVRIAAPEIKKELIALIPHSIGYISQDLESILQTALDAKIYMSVIKYVKEISGEGLAKVNPDLMGKIVNELKKDTFLRDPEQLMSFLDQIKVFPASIAVQEYRSTYNNPDLIVQSAEKIQKFYSNFDAAYESIIKTLIDDLAEINNEDSMTLLEEISQDQTESESIKNYAQTKLPK
ncbi:hypothetical protein HZA97_05250 [Candidatus Woesearchaeota archaeon]|nr:hypothetical protein [Candidatus Woesearchaeota archaeon]